MFSSSVTDPFDDSDPDLHSATLLNIIILLLTFVFTDVHFYYSCFIMYCLNLFITGD